MTPEVLTRELRTILARLELVSTAPVCNYNPNGGGEPTGLPSGDSFPPHEHYRRRLHSIDRGLQRRLDASEATGDTEQREREERKAHGWHHEARLQVLKAATDTLKALTGRTGEAPERHVGKLDTEHGVRQAIIEDAPGRPAEDVAAKLGVTVFIVRRVYFELELDTKDGTSLNTAREDRSQKVHELKAKGLTSRQIAQITGMHQTQVMRELKKAA